MQGFAQRAVALVMLLCAAWSMPLAADWLVTQDGDQIETQGEWKVKGKLVVFTSPQGALTSIRASEVDLDASAVLTEKAKNPPPPPPPAPPEKQKAAVRVFTDDDIRAATPEAPLPPASDGEEGEGSTAGGEETGEEDGEEGEEGEEANKDGGVEVESWRISASDQVEGVEIFGSLRNRGAEMAAELSLVARVADEDGNQLAEQSAFLKNNSLLPGRATSFRVLLPGLSSLPTDPTFVIKSRGIRMQ